ncbi:NUDIX hydrolase [Streptomyces sp. NPDC059740]|uniref:NUDIX hydrolase n=1 Tax=Streptomyces sp. NPDC059740 TaxID=3346926 RepID=UPI00365E667F
MSLAELHGDAVEVLKGWTASDAQQERLRDAYLEHLAAHPDGVARACAAGHLTASTLVVDPPRQRVLLTLHRKLRMWLQMGGHCEDHDATLAAAALREGREESGLGTALTLLPVGPVRLDRHLTPCAWHLDVQYAALAPEGVAPEISDESLDLRWFSFEEVPHVADASVVRLLEATLAVV